MQRVREQRPVVVACGSYTGGMRAFHLSLLAELDQRPRVSVVRLTHHDHQSDAVIADHQAFGIEHVVIVRSRGRWARLAHKVLPIFAIRVALVAAKFRTNEVLLTMEGFTTWLVPSVVLSRTVSLFVHDPHPHESTSRRAEFKRHYQEVTLKHKRYRALLVGDKRFVVELDQSSKSPVEYLHFPAHKKELYPVSSRLPELDSVSDYVLFFGSIDLYKGIYEWLETIEPILDSVGPVVVAGRVWDERVRRFDSKVILIDRYLDDSEIGSLIDGCRAMVLPYISATHSGVGDLALEFGKRLYYSDVPFFQQRFAGEALAFPLSDFVPNEKLQR